MKRIALGCLVLIFLTTACLQTPQSGEDGLWSASATQVSTFTPSADPTGEALTRQPGSAFIRARNRELVVGDPERVIYLRGINFSNYIWNSSHAELISTQHHSAEDFLVVKDMGMNVIRFNLSTYHFEDSANPYHYLESGWAWMDQEIQSAKEAGVYLILNIHFAPGMDNDGDGSIWVNDDYRDRVTAVWAAIAERYADEPIIAGYDLFNEPEPPTMEIWAEWVDEMVAAIRQHDPNHLIILEGVNGIIDQDGNWVAVENPFVSVADDNLMLDFHFYEPFEFTHQEMEWAGMYTTSTYPDLTPVLDWENMVWAASSNSDALVVDSSDWDYYSGDLTGVMGEDAKLGKPNPFCSSMDAFGSAYFGRFVVNEYDSAGTLIQTVVEGEVFPEQNWWFWSADGRGEWQLTEAAEPGTYAIRLQGITDAATLSNEAYTFVVHPGSQYSIEGWMRGEQVSAGTVCHFSLELYGLTDGVEISMKNRELLERKIDTMAGLAETMNRPLNLGEFGVNWYGWQEDRGGDRWYRDVVEIAVENGLSFQSWAYHDVFGIYQEWNVLPRQHTQEQINWALQNTLIDLFKEINTED